MPNIYIIAGCNGAGKTTASYTVLPEILDCKEFVNADNIAAGISPFNPQSVALAAGRIMLERISELMKEGADFAFETTLSTRSYMSLIRRYHRGLSNLLNLYLPICDRWMIMDNMDLVPEIITQKDEFGEVVVNNEIWSNINACYYGKR
ncbi:zeta toxin [Sphingobacterium lumbrici]|uniref:zeta toxin n=1 Tax=Sphingobacterium lumbrici TaxID=2559600 RepID=UPI00112DAEEC|nr:zeta toxin [Sphingobacterium lumbrici]